MLNIGACFENLHLLVVRHCTNLQKEVEAVEQCLVQFKGSGELVASIDSANDDDIGANGEFLIMHHCCTIVVQQRKECVVKPRFKTIELIQHHHQVTLLNFSGEL